MRIYPCDLGVRGPLHRPWNIKEYIWNDMNNHIYSYILTNRVRLKGLKSNSRRLLWTFCTMDIVWFQNQRKYWTFILNPRNGKLGTVSVPVIHIIHLPSERSLEPGYNVHPEREREQCWSPCRRYLWGTPKTRVGMFSQRLHCRYWQLENDPWSNE